MLFELCHWVFDNKDLKVVVLMCGISEFVPVSLLSSILETLKVCHAHTVLILFGESPIF